MSRKFLLILCVVNTVLFTAANLVNISIWLVLMAEVVLYGLWVVIRHRLNPNDPLQRVRAAIREIESKGEIRNLHLVKAGVEGLLSDRQRVRYSIEEQKLEPMTLAYLLIHNVAVEGLTTGENHIYRGTLSMAGRELESVYTAAVQKLVEVGYMSEAERRQDGLRIEQEIKSVG
jgi:hypothetical protein